MASVLVLGGGFAGLAAARRLARGRRDARVHLIDARGETVFSPLLPDLISGRVRPGSVTAPIEPLCRACGARFTRATVTRIEPESGRVFTDAGEHQADFIILATGCVTNYFGNEQIERRALGLKSVAEATTIHDRLTAMVDAAAAGGPPGAVVVVGGGYTGFEAASHAAHLIHARSGLPFDRIREVCPVVVVEKAGITLANVSDKVRVWAGRLMDGCGIEVITGVTACAPDAGGAVTLSNGRALPNALLLWTTGVTPGPETAFATERVRGRLAVEGGLRVKGCDRLFAAGDVAAPIPPGAKEPLRMGVQFSLRGGDCAARSVLARLRGQRAPVFDPWDPGYIVPLTPRRAAGVVAGVKVRGLPASALHYLMCIYRSWRWRERIGILKDLL